MTREITKREWYAKGGLRNSNLFRRQSDSGKWHYYEGATK